MIFILPLVIIVLVLAWLLRPGKSPTKPRKVGILVSVLPPFTVAIAAIVFQVMHNAAGKTWVSDISNTCFLVGLGLTGLAILASLSFTIMRKVELAKGIGFGACINIIISIILFGFLEWLGGV